MVVGAAFTGVMGDAGVSQWRVVGAELVRAETIGDLLRGAVEAAPEVCALVEGVAEPAARRRWTYGELSGEVRRAAWGLLARFDVGERVAVWANNIPEWTILQLAAAVAGMPLVTVDPALRRDEVRHVLRTSGAVGVFLVRRYRDNPMAETVDQLRGDLPALREVVYFDQWRDFAGTPTPLPEVRPGDTAQIQFTSGTTGVPKGVVLHHSGLVNSARLSYTRTLRLRRADPVLNAMPLFHTAGSVLATLSAIAAGSTHVLMPYFDPGLFLRLVEQERSVLVAGVPTMLRALLDHPALPGTDLSSVRCALSGGAVVPPELVARVEEAFGVPLAVIYAQTEASPAITMTDPYTDSAADRAGTIGRPVAGVEVAVVSGGRVVPVGEPGELCTRGHHVMTGYLDQPEQTALTVDADGWLHTGDLAAMDGRGYCRIAGRLKEMIIRGGENLFPREIEDVLARHPGVAEVVVFGVPDEHWGEQPAAVVRARPGATLTEDELVAYGRAHLARQKVPRLWRFVDHIPTTGSGKVLRSRLRDLVLAEAPVPPDQNSSDQNSSHSGGGRGEQAQ
ncbi:AMP-binding protein [Actinokineospora globicatena]|uniref:AMP-binding protein n=2 Tax=Actinokineospora globicatena TaxID=103729 RepID=A0A9W6QJA0_9PSEU|nr:AMP-binding protein [Actinokineospora globicatena]